MKPRKFSIDFKKFADIKDPEIAYTLGILWADGYIYQTEKQNKVVLEIVAEDAKEIFPIIHFAGAWGVYYRKREGRKEQASSHIQDKELVTWLKSNDYDAKSEKAAHKILSLIPVQLHSYWFRGLIDGDGSFYINESDKYNQCQFGITSSLNQDWSYFTQLLDKLNIKYSIQKISRKCGQHSTVRVTNRADIIKLCEFVYKGFPADNIGLTRKFAKYRRIKVLVEKSLRNQGNEFPSHPI